MKSIAKICFAALVISAAFSCTKEALVEKNQQIKEGMMPYEATISMDATKASLDGKTVVWAVGDKIAIYDGVNADANEFQVVSASGNTATITGQISQEATTLWGVFPFSSAAGLEGVNKDSLKVNVPSTQEIATGKTIASDALVSVSKAAVGATLNFKNAVSLVKFTLPIDGVKRVVFSGSTGATGAMGVKVGESLALAYSGKTALTVSKADGFAKNTAYYATVFAQEQAGVKFVLTTADYKSVVSSANAATFAVNAGSSFMIDEAKINAGKFPINIYTKEDLDAFAAHAASYDVGEWVNLCADIDYDGEWTAVADFEGNFNGNNHSIYGSTKGLTFKANSAYPTFIGFFSKIYAEVKDLKLGYNPETEEADSLSDLKYAETIEYAGPLAGTAASRSGVGPVKITNVQNYVTQHATYTTALATEKSLRAGNIVGAITCDQTQVTSCANYMVIGNDSKLAACVDNQYFGGLAGLVSGNDVTITDCNNYGEVLPCVNAAVTSGSFFNGGVVGRLGGGTSNMKFIRCKNFAEKVAASRNVKKQIFLGGILGADNEETDVTMENCVNESPYLKLGSQSDNCASGGMIGYAKSKVLLDGCVNGKKDNEEAGLMVITGNNLAYAGYGGIIGYASGASGVIKGCTNYGPQTYTTAFSKVCPDGFGRGGIVGLIKGSSSLSIENSVNYGAINMAYSKVSTGYTNGAGIGGIIGSNLSESTISNCENYGAIKETGTVDVAGAGGLIGYQAAITQTGAGCKVDCTVTSVNKGGMIVGNNVGTAVYGTESSKIKVHGTFNSISLDSSNYTNYLYAGASTATCNAEFWAK